MTRAAATTRSRILAIGTNLLSVSGLSGVTLGTLAERTGMSKSGLFAHFKSKEEIQLSLLEHASSIAQAAVLEPALLADEGLPRLKTLIGRWFGWTSRAGLEGGCPIAAGIFELDDAEGPVRDRVAQMESSWRGLLAQHVRKAVELGHLQAHLDVDQFVWEVCGIYLSHHASVRFLRDPAANGRAEIAMEALLTRSLPSPKTKEAP